MKAPIRIYFLCMQNRCRSQIAEAYARYYGGPNVIAQSAGLESEEIHPLTIEVMREEGIDLRQQYSKPIDMKTFMNSKVVVKLCEQLKERSPVVPFGIQNHQWDIPDPLPSEDIAEVRKTREVIRQKVLELLSNLNVLKADHGDAVPGGTTENFADLFKLLGDRNRLTIVSLLKQRELCVCELVEFLQTSQPNISQHLRKLKDAGLLNESKRGHWVYYSLNTENKPYFEPIINSLPTVKEKLHQLSNTTPCN
jgi:arsenate reductase (thioredoxin)